jgi:hypothetical protein
VHGADAALRSVGDDVIDEIGRPAVGGRPVSDVRSSPQPTSSDWLKFEISPAGVAGEYVSRPTVGASVDHVGFAASIVRPSSTLGSAP